MPGSEREYDEIALGRTGLVRKRGLKNKRAVIMRSESLRGMVVFFDDRISLEA